MKKKDHHYAYLKKLAKQRGARAVQLRMRKIPPEIQHDIIRKAETEFLTLNAMCAGFKNFCYGAPQ